MVSSVTLAASLLLLGGLAPTRDATPRSTSPTVSTPTASTPTASTPTASTPAPKRPTSNAPTSEARWAAGRLGWTRDWSHQPRWQIRHARRRDCRPDNALRLRTVRTLRCPSQTTSRSHDSNSPEPASPAVSSRVIRGPRQAMLPPWAVLGREIDLGEPRAAAVRGARPDADPTALDANAAMALSFDQCRTALEVSETRFDLVDPKTAPEVAQPIRVRALGGVRFVIPWSRKPDDPHTIWDCRLAVAMLPLARWLAQHGVSEARYVSVLRRGAIARRKPRSQHNHGLAIDVLGFVLSRQYFEVEQHYPRGVVAQCPASGLQAGHLTHAQRLYANFVCTAARRGLVHTLLTPDHDRAHENHLHLDVKANMRSPVDPYVSFAGQRAR